MARAGDEVAFGLENRCVPADAIWPRVDAALAAVDFPYDRDRPTYALSGGEQQRLALAATLALAPGLLLLDEPTSNLDPESAAEIRAVVGQAVERLGATLVIVEHRVGEWLPIVDRVVVLEAGGGVVATGPAPVVSRYQALVADQKAKKDSLRAAADADQKTYDALNYRDDQFDLSDVLTAIAISLLAITSLTQKRWLFGIAMIPTVLGIVMGLAGLMDGTRIPRRSRRCCRKRSLHRPRDTSCLITRRPNRALPSCSTCCTATRRPRGSARRDARRRRRRGAARAPAGRGGEGDGRAAVRSRGSGVRRARARAPSRVTIMQRMDEQAAVRSIDAMSADQQADLFRELPEQERPRFLKQLDAPTRAGARAAAPVSAGHRRAAS